MRLVASLVFLTSLSLPCAYASNEKEPDPQSIAALADRANQAEPREQCFLYAELVHQMTELAGRQLSSGEADLASATLRAVQGYAQKIHLGLSKDNRRVKNAEILMRHTSFRLKELLYGASTEDRPILQATLTQLDQVQAELMLQVFKK